DALLPFKPDEVAKIGWVDAAATINRLSAPETHSWTHAFFGCTRFVAVDQKYAAGIEVDDNHRFAVGTPASAGDQNGRRSRPCDLGHDVSRRELRHHLRFRSTDRYVTDVIAVDLA